jgi:hypothetical protein
LLLVKSGVDTVGIGSEVIREPVACQPRHQDHGFLSESDVESVATDRTRDVVSEAEDMEASDAEMTEVMVALSETRGEN